ncbi:MAG: DUF3387 domain-containing protein [bacterium]|nr:DUF3387 domain-containing protein [bacterium]
MVTFESGKIPRLAVVNIYAHLSLVLIVPFFKLFWSRVFHPLLFADNGKQLIDELDDELRHDRLESTQKAKAKWTKLEALIGSENRIKQVARDIILHFENRQIGNDGKAMIVAMSRRIAAELYREIIKIRPQWHHDDLKKGDIKVVMTSTSADGPEIAKHHTVKEQRRVLADRMKDPWDELKLVIVRDMWLTGFDVPCLHTLYIDKPMRGHNLMQAIARVNRVYKDKKGGLVVDYLGIASELKNALSFYSETKDKGDPTITQEKAVQLMLEKLEIVSRQFEGFNYEDYFEADTGKKLSLILAAQNFILGLENGNKRYIDNVAYNFSARLKVNLNYLILGKGEPFAFLPVKIPRNYNTDDPISTYDQLIWYLNRSPFMRNTLFEFTSKYLWEYGYQIEVDIEKNKHNRVFPVTDGCKFEPSVLVDFGKRIKLVREQLEFTQIQLAESTSNSRDTIMQIENGQVKCGIDFLFYVSDVFGVNLYYLVHGIGDMFLNQKPSIPGGKAFGDAVDSLKLLAWYLQASPLLRAATISQAIKTQYANESAIIRDLKNFNGG